MDILLNRKGGVPLHDQLLAQLELKILSGGIAPGHRLPSVRALARRLGLHANTVSAAYRALEEAGHVELRRGAGVYVRAGVPSTLEEAHGLDEMIRLALSAAFRKGHSGADFKAAVERWLRAAPPERILIVDPRPETVALLVQELRQALPVPVAGCTVRELTPVQASGALVVALQYHAAEVARRAPGAAIEVMHVEVGAPEREALRALPEGATVLVVSGSPLVLQFASAFAVAQRGDEVLVETRPLARAAEWKRLVPAADLVFADVLAAGAVAAARPRRLRELRLLDERSVARVRRALSDIVPRD